MQEPIPFSGVPKLGTVRRACSDQRHSEGTCWTIRLKHDNSCRTATADSQSVTFSSHQRGGATMVDNGKLVQVRAALPLEVLIELKTKHYNYVI